MKISATTRWVLLALVGLAIAIGVAIAAANLTSQQIGIASESVSAGDALAPSLHVPAEAKPQPEGHDHGPEETTSPTFPAEPPTTTTPEEETVQPPSEGKSDDYGGGGSDGDD